LFIARILRKALELIDGKTALGWEKGAMGRFDLKFDGGSIEDLFELDSTEIQHVAQVCSLGAVQLATRELGGTMNDYTKTADFLAGVGIDLDLRGFGEELEDMDDRFWKVASFNDKYETTLDDVTALFREAIARAEALPVFPEPTPALT
jgi:hypothetical protein